MNNEQLHKGTLSLHSAGSGTKMRKYRIKYRPPHSTFLVIVHYSSVIVCYDFYKYQSEYKIFANRIGIGNPVLYTIELRIQYKAGSKDGEFL